MLVLYRMSCVMRTRRRRLDNSMTHLTRLNSHNKRMRQLFILISSLLAGCFSDDPMDLDFHSQNDIVQETDGNNPNGTDSDTATGTGSKFDLDLPTEPPVAVELHMEDYVGFAEANDTWGPAGAPPTVDYDHTGYLKARCFECHAEDQMNPPEGHNPKMQYWAWSCSRGFPGGACHGHGVNGTIPFNHARDPAFSNCTSTGCHDQFNAERKDFENHGMHEVPTDEFCHACHDYTWTGWPDSDFY